MKMLRVIDKYDDDRIWVIKVYSRGEVFLNQEIKGIMQYTKFARTTKKYLNMMLEKNINEIIALDEMEEKETCRSKEEITYRDNFIAKCRAYDESIINEADIF